MRSQVWATSVREAVDDRNRKQTKAAAMWSNSSLARFFYVWTESASQNRGALQLQRRILARMQNGIVFDVSLSVTGPVAVLREAKRNR
jgi:hypothetical protein